MEYKNNMNTDNYSDEEVITDEDGIVIIQDDEDEIIDGEPTSASYGVETEESGGYYESYDESDSQKRGGFRVYTFGMNKDNSLVGRIRSILLWIIIIFILIFVFRFMFSVFVFLLPVLIISYLISLFRKLK